MIRTAKALLSVLLFTISATLVSAQTPPGIVLNSQWATSMKDGVETMEELNRLLGSYAKPSESTAPAPNLKIYNDITYLMPLDAAIKSLGLTRQVSAPREVICPGFPYHSLLAHGFSGKFEDDYNIVHIVTDLARQVVAIQFATATPGGRDGFGGDPSGFTYDFINSRRKALSTAQVTHWSPSMPQDAVIRIDSAFLSPVDSRGNLKAKYATHLYLPRPLVGLILFRISKSST